MRDLVCLHDLEEKFVYVSPSSETMLGYTPAEQTKTEMKNFKDQGEIALPVIEEN